MHTARLERPMHSDVVEEFIMKISLAGDATTSRSDRRLVVVITGGTAGVGRAVARRFASDGEAVAVIARGRDGLVATAREIEALGGRALALNADVAHAEEMFAAADRIEYELGPIDIWINNAMTTVFGPVDRIRPSEYRRVTDVTYHGFVWGTMAALRVMRPRRRGTIVQVGSALAYRAIPLQAAYCGAKHAIRGFTDSLRSELAHDKLDIHLTMVQLPAINTPQFDWCLDRMEHAAQPVPPIFQPEIAADAIHYAAHHPRREHWVGASTLGAILLQKLMPGVLDRLLARRGYRGQMADRPMPTARPNLFVPSPGDHGAHGAFDSTARSRAPITRAAARLGSAGLQALLLAGLAAILAASSRAGFSAARRALRSAL
jgi:NAD(P)-dependent dehydrogenase (short-subunit alcohol dehydrogenase family)